MEREEGLSPSTALLVGNRNDSREAWAVAKQYARSHIEKYDAEERCAGCLPTSAVS